MAILGFLTHTLTERVQDVERALSAMPELTTYGIHKECYVVAVADAPAAKMEAVVDRVKAVDGVIAVYVTSYTTEDEDEPISGEDVFGHKAPN